MRVLRRAIAEKDGAGSITMIADDEEDIWHAYNLVNTGDRVETTAIRKVVRETATGSTSSSKVHTSLVIAVERVQYDGDTGALLARLDLPVTWDDERVASPPVLDARQATIAVVTQFHTYAVALRRDASVGAATTKLGALALVAAVAGLVWLAAAG